VVSGALVLAGALKGAGRDQLLLAGAELLAARSSRRQPSARCHESGEPAI